MSDICPGSEPTEDRRGETGVFGAGLDVEERDQIVKRLVHFVVRFLVMGVVEEFCCENPLERKLSIAASGVSRSHRPAA